ncbi:MAG: CHAT domain-containing protein, partial [Desulfobacterales bacterium]|nr:CHAT domain-containing protein [Desulfobacterales bacterium]
LGDYSKAEPLYKRALAVAEKVLGPEHPNTALSLNNLAMLYESLGDYSKAEPLYKRALAINEKVLGPEHPDTAQSLNNIAGLYCSLGDYSKAEPLYKRALAIKEKVLGSEHPDTAISLNNIAGLYAAGEDFLHAHKFRIRAQNIEGKIIDQVMGFTSEEQKIQFLSTRKAALEATISLAAFNLSSESQVIADVLNVWLRRKGVILEAQRRYQDAMIYSDDPEAVEVFQSLSRVRSQLSRLAFGRPVNISPENLRLKIAELEKEKDDLEAKLSRLSQAFAKQKTVERADVRTVAGALPQNTALLEFAKIPKINFKAKGKEPMWGVDHYLAFVVHAGKGDKVRLVNLGEAGNIDEAIAGFKHSVADSAAGSEESQRAEIGVYTRKLYSLVFEPIKKELGPVKEVFISPDGNLNLIPFEALQDPQGRYLIEDYTFNYLAAGRDIAGFGKIKEKAGRCLLMGDPDFDMSGEEKESALTRLGLNRQNENQILTARRSGEMRGMRFAPLPGTRKEIEAIAGILGPEKAETFTGKQALSEVLATRRSPRILHIATHGFFLVDQDITAFADSKDRGITTVKPLPIGKFDNPLRRSGLALAGANLSLQTENPDASDGLLTAEKVLGLRLGGTELVVLSACQTGLGDVKAGEGVYGLRRAITQAGAKGLVMSMWSVPDRETQELMTAFYRNLESGRYSRVQALRMAALEQIETVRNRYGNTNPFYWGAFVYMGEP